MTGRGFNRDRNYGKNSSRGYYRGRNSFRGGNVAGGAANTGRGSRGRRPKTSAVASSVIQPDNDANESNVLTESEFHYIRAKRFDDSHMAYDLDEVVKTPYPGWKLYFVNDDYKASATIVRKVKTMEKFIARHSDLFNEDEIEERRSCVFDLQVCSIDAELIDKWPTFRDDVYEDPVTTLHCLGLAIHQTVWKSMKEQSIAINNDNNDEPLVSIKVPMIRARISNYNTVTQLKNLKTHLFGKLVSVNGTVIRVGNIKLQCSWLAFKCAGCQFIQCVKQPDGVLTQPTRCLDKNCRCRIFIPLRSSAYTQTCDWQTVRLQEQVPDDQREGGRVPRTVECELFDDLVSSCTPGDTVTVVGIVKVQGLNQNSRKSRGPCMYTLYLEAVSIFNNKNMDCMSGLTKEGGVAVRFTQKDYDAIQEIHSEPNLFKLLVHSLCPTIYGHEVVKAGLLLALFGGSLGESSDFRGQAHVLLVGDPGLGKSQMLQTCSFVSPRGVFVCGNTTTSSGLTVTLSREGGGDFALEAGALVLADQGCCCIDEFDKMNSHHQALLEVMEQQTVSIAKAGIICMLPARTTVLAAANPAGGHYNKGKTVSENLRLGQALLSRFDLVFILLDQPNELLDGLLSEHVMKMHSGLDARTKVAHNECESLSRLSLISADILIGERLKKKASENLDILPASLLRKYVAYAQQYIPVVTISVEAKNVLQDFYLHLRQSHHTMDSTPVTTRQLLSLIRLTQARAKLELREEATLEDALDVIDIVRWSLIDTYSDAFGGLDFQRSQHGSGMSCRNQAKKFLTALHRKSETSARSIFSVDEMKEVARSIELNMNNFSSFISTLNIQGFLLKKGMERYQILSAD